jgi:hypothetical protein
MRFAILLVLVSVALLLAPPASAGPAPTVPQVGTFDIHVGVGVSVGPSYRRTRRCYYTPFGRRYCRTHYVRTYRAPRYYYPGRTYHAPARYYAPTYRYVAPRAVWRPYYRRYTGSYYYGHGRPYYRYRYSSPRAIGRRR